MAESSNHLNFRKQVYLDAGYACFLLLTLCNIEHMILRKIIVHFDDNYRAVNVWNKSIMRMFETVRHQRANGKQLKNI